MDTIVVKSVRLQLINDEFEVDEDFADAWRTSKEPWSVDRIPYLDYFIQEGYFFKGTRYSLSETMS